MNHDNYRLNLLRVIAVAEAFGELDRSKTERKYWVDPINSRREESGKFDEFYKNIRKYPENFFEYFRMSVTSFDELLESIRPHITKEITIFRNPISAEQRLTITLRFLSVGSNFTTLKQEFSLGRSTVRAIVKETCEVIWLVLLPREMPEPNCEQWTDIANKFYKKTQFPNCVGAVDGKHIRCVSLKNTESIYFNRKKCFSLVLMAVVDSDYRFISIDVGASKREGNSSVLKKCPFGKKLYSEQLDLPAPICLPNTDNAPQPFVIIGNGTFGLHKNLLRPFPERGLDQRKKIFNYRLLRARRYVECAFGLLTNKWKVLQTVIKVETEFGNIIVKACCILHNFVCKRDESNFEDTLSNSLEEIDIYRSGIGARSEGINVRDYFSNYFMEVGSIPLQFRFV